MNKTVRMLWIGLLVSAITSQAQVSAKIKWACVGNSITQGTTGGTNAWPAGIYIQNIKESSK